MSEQGGRPSGGGGRLDPSARTSVELGGSISESPLHDHIPEQNSGSFQKIVAQALHEVMVIRKKARAKRIRRAQEKAEHLKSTTKIAALLLRVPVVGKALKDKYLHSKLVSYIEGRGLSPPDVDLLVNSVTLVNALILTIPPSIITSLGQNSGSWQGLQDNIALCGIAGSDTIWDEQVYQPMFASLLAGPSGPGVWVA